MKLVLTLLLIAVASTATAALPTENATSTAAIAAQIAVAKAEIAALEERIAMLESKQALLNEAASSGVSRTHPEDTTTQVRDLAAHLRVQRMRALTARGVTSVQRREDNRGTYIVGINEKLETFGNAPLKWCVTNCATFLERFHDLNPTARKGTIYVSTDTGWRIPIMLEEPVQEFAAAAPTASAPATPKPPVDWHAVVTDSHQLDIITLIANKQFGGDLSKVRPERIWTTTLPSHERAPATDDGSVWYEFGLVYDGTIVGDVTAASQDAALTARANGLGLNQTPPQPRA
jgi:cell division protein FtsB